MNKNDIFIGLQEIYPEGVVGIDSEVPVTDYTSFSEAWGDGPSETIPTESALQTALDARNIAEPKSNMKADIKAKAGDIINSEVPEWKQRNCLAFSIEYNAKLINSETPTEDETTKYEEIESLWVWVKAVRDYSDSLEVDVDAGDSVDLESGWPTL